MKKNAIFKWILVFCFICMTACSTKPMKSIQDGTYIGSGEGYGGEIQVEVKILNGRIDTIEVVDENETQTWSTAAIENIPKYMISEQSIQVDTQTGATLTSHAIQDAVKDAIEQAKGNIDDWNKDCTGKHEIKVIEKQSQVIVIGGGLSGITTTLRLEQLGISCTLLEKSSTLGGQLQLGGNYTQLYSSEKEDNSYLLKKQLQDASTNATVQDILLDTLQDTVEWQQSDLGIVFQDEYETSTSKQYTNGSTNIGELLAKEAQVSGAEIYTNTIATSIESKENTTHVQAIDKDGKVYDFTSDHVIIASGSFASDDQLYAGYRSDTGDMYTIAKDSGIEVSEDEGNAYTNVAIALDDTYALDCYDALQKTASKGIVLVNQDGNRYVNEMTNRQTLNASIQQPSYLIMNAYVYKQWKEELLESVDDETLKKRIQEDEIDLYIGDTLQEACTQASIDYQTVLDSLYDIIMATNDSQLDAFGREHTDVIDPSDTIYIIPLQKATLASNSGIAFEDDLQVNGMEHVYVIGNACGDLYSDTVLEGYMNGWAVVSAKYVADNIALQYEK